MQLTTNRAFLLLRYTLIVATAYLLLVEREFLLPPVETILLLVAALASNVVVAQLPTRVTSSPAFSPAIIVADTVWITAALLQSGSFNTEFFFLYFFVLLLAGIGESLPLIVLGTIVVCIAYIYLLLHGGGVWKVWSSPSLIRIPFLFSAAAFYGYLVDRARQERRRADAHEAEQKRATLQLAHVTSDFSQLIETANAPIVGVDRNKMVNEWNQKVSDLTGHSRAEMVGRMIVDEFVPTDHRIGVESVLDRALVGQESGGFEFPLHTRDGRRVTILFNATTRRDAAGNIVGAWGVGQDVTELSAYRETLEQRIDERTRELTESLDRERRLSNELRESLEREKQLGHLKSRFVSMASHEFRTPLTAILGASDVLKCYGDQLSPEEKGLRLDKIQQQVNHMTSLLEDILTVGKADASQLDFDPVPLEVEQFCQELVEETRRSARPAHPILLSFTGSRTNVPMDPKLLRNILSNLLSNATKYSPEDKPIKFDVASENGTTVFRIRDFGIGVPEQDLDRVFEPFHRGANATTISGTGLGLAIVKRAVERHGGHISIESKLNHGTAFTVTIPCPEPAGNDDAQDPGG